MSQSDRRAATRTAELLRIHDGPREAAPHRIASLYASELFHMCSDPNSGKTGTEPLPVLPDEEVPGMLDALTVSVWKGEVTTLEQVAGKVRALFPSHQLGQYGGATREIESAASSLYVAIETYNITFPDSPIQR